jgi:transcription termination/antitermination protein NusA
VAAQPFQVMNPKRKPSMTLGTPAQVAEELWACLRQIDAELDAKRKDLGVDDALRDIPGVLVPMLVALGENGIRTVEDFAACATDDLIGWTERNGQKNTTHVGILDGLVLSREECDRMILQARVSAGWIDEAPSTTVSSR